MISSSPRSYVYHNFLSMAEADHIVALAKPFVSWPWVPQHDLGKRHQHTIRKRFGISRLCALPYELSCNVCSMLLLGDALQAERPCLGKRSFFAA